MGDERQWRTWTGLNGDLYAWAVGTSPAVVVHAPTAALLATQIIRAGVELDDKTYWPDQLARR